jgi:hypothetical protein
MKGAHRPKPVAAGSSALRMAVGASAVAAAAVTGITAIVAAEPEWRRLAVVLTLIAISFMTASLFRQPSLLPPAGWALAGAAAISFVGTDVSTWQIAALAGLVLASLELAGWALDLCSVVPASAPVIARRAVQVAVTSVGAVLAAILVMRLSELPPPRGALPLLVGLSAALGLAALVTIRRWEN